MKTDCDNVNENEICVESTVGDDDVNENEIYVESTVGDLYKKVSSMHERGEILRSGKVCVHKFCVPSEYIAHISYETKVTKNLGNYENIKIGIKVEIPCYREEIKDAVEFSRDFCENEIGSHLEEYTKKPYKKHAVLLEAEKCKTDKTDMMKDQEVDIRPESDISDVEIEWEHEKIDDDLGF